MNGQLPSSVALDPAAQPGPCPCRLVCRDCRCSGLDVPQHLFEDDGDGCDPMDGSVAFLQLSASLWFKHGTPLLLDLDDCPEPPGRQELGFCGGFAAEVKQARPALPLPAVHAARWEASFTKKRGDIEKMEAQKQRRSDRRGQKMLGWESKHEDNLIHMSRFGKQTDRSRKRLAALDPIPPSDDEDSDDL